jgi:hypothetical protein
MAHVLVADVELPEGTDSRVMAVGLLFAVTFWPVWACIGVASVIFKPLFRGAE